MIPVFAGLFSQFIYKPVLGPVIRILSGLIAIPLFRFFLRRVFRVRASDAELERDLEHWFRGAILLLLATANLEDYLFGWTQWHQNSEPWLTMFLRLLLAIGVIETMPDEDLFALVHRGPPHLRLERGIVADAWRKRARILRGLGVLHLKRSSPVFVIMCVVFGGSSGTWEFTVGWWCYGLALVQYLIIALTTDRGRAAALLAAINLKNIPAAARQMGEAAGDSGDCAAPEADRR